MIGDVDMQKAQREESRWRILVALNSGRPLAVSETIVLRCLHDIRLPITPHSLRRELDYLEERQLIKLLDKDSSTWSAELTRHGIDLVEYTQPCDPGIARPKKWD